MTAAKPRRGARASLALVVVLLLAIAGAVFLVSRAPSSAGSPSGAAEAGVVAAADGSTEQPLATDNAAAGLRAGGADSVVLRGPEPGVAAAASTGEDPETLDRLAAETEAQRRVFDRSANGPRPPPLGTRMGRRRGASGTIGIGNSPKLEGRVTDAMTGDPIEGAVVVSLFAEEDGWARHYMTVTTEDDGTFRARIPTRHAEKTEFLVRAPGYRQQRVARADAPEEWRLVPVEGSGRGTVRGRAETPDGAPLEGMLLVALRSEHGDEGDQYTWSDASGTFELAGLRPGRWRLSLERELVTETTVVEGGLSTARLVAERPDATADEQHRVVEVSGLAEWTTVRADAGPGVHFRAVVEGGVARFDLPFGLWILTVDEKDGAVQPITVRAAHGARRIEFVPDRE